MLDEQPTPIPKFIRRVMPTANDAELREAAENFMQYMTAVLHIYDRIKQEQAGADSHESESHGRVANDPTV